MSEYERPSGLPVWDGVPRDEIPLRLGKGLDLLVNLKGRRNFPAGDVLSELLNRGAARHIRGAKIELDDKGDTSVALWVPAFEDQKTDAAECAEPTAHVPLPEADRWEIAELTFAVVGATMPDRAVYFGFLTADSSFVLPWHDYCWHYPHPPEYVFGFWEYVEE